MRYRLFAMPLLAQLAIVQTAYADEQRGNEEKPAQTPAVAEVYSAKDFFETLSVGLPGPGSLAFSPDGKKLLISSDTSGIANAYALAVDGSRAAPLTASREDAIFPISYFPRDGRVLLASDRGGNELTHLFVREIDGTVRDLTPGEKVKVEFMGWSADGTEFRILSNARDPSTFDLYAVDVANYDARMLSKSDGREMLGISPDGRWVVSSERSGTSDANLYLLDLVVGGPAKLITAHSGKALHESLGFTPDSKALLVSTDAHGEFAEAWRYDLATGKMNRELKGEWDVSWVKFSSSGRYRVSAFNEDGRTRLTIFDLVRKRDIELGDLPEGDIGQVRFSPDEAMIAFTISSDRSPPDVYVATLNEGRSRRLTYALGPKLKENDLIEARVVRLRAKDGIEIPSLLYRPKSASKDRPVPALVWVHGGPDQSRRGWSPTIQHLVNNGYAVIAPNFRGSLGYGKTFFHLDDRKHGDADLDDVVLAGEWMRKQPWVDSGHVAVMGRSYGGFLTTAALAFRPTAFEAGIDIFGVTNWERTLASLPPWWESLRKALYEEMGDPASDGERHRRISPLFHASKIRRPLLVVQGANDPRVLKAESDDLVAAVRANGTPVEYILFDDEGHGFRRRENLIRSQEAYLDFLRKYLRK